MKLSIIIPVYNTAKFLSLCLDSLLSQSMSLTDYEILIINDGSTDNTLSIANAYCDKYNSIKVFSKPNGGVGSARNKGISLAKGDYIYFIDPDDYLANDVLEIILQQAEINDLDILTFKSKVVLDNSLYHKTPNKIGIQLSVIRNGEDYIANNNYKNEVWWYVIKRDFFEETKIKFIENRWMEDAILTAELLLKANKVANFPIDAHRYLLVEGSAMNNKESSHYLKIIDDNRNASIVFESLINVLEQNKANPLCIKRLRIRQQSFVFFLMVRMFKSTINFEQAKNVLEEISNTNAYPFSVFPGNDYKGLNYYALSKLLSNKRIFYILFRLCNPVLRIS